MIRPFVGTESLLDISAMDDESVLVLGRKIKNREMDQSEMIRAHQYPSTPYLLLQEVVSAASVLAFLPFLSGRRHLNYLMIVPVQATVTLLLATMRW